MAAWYSPAQRTKEELSTQTRDKRHSTTLGKNIPQDGIISSALYNNGHALVYKKIGIR